MDDSRMFSVRFTKVKGKAFFQRLSFVDKRQQGTECFGDDRTAETSHRNAHVVPRKGSEAYHRKSIFLKMP